MRFLVVLVLFFWSWFSDKPAPELQSNMLEICDNGIDDDMDGLIDLNDTTDCKCDGLENVVFKPSSLIPNPSFEDTLCCPEDLASLNCAANWIQASSATSDYFHTCGYAFNPERGRPPQPLPAGDAYVGFLDIRGFFFAYKEYVGACLNEPMTVGTEYTLQFYLGFGTAGTIYSSRSPMEIVLYGTNNCNGLPFGGNNFQNCPSVLPNWFEIGSVVLRGSNEWVQATMSFTATSNIAAVALGPGCARSQGSYYYFLDDLVLNESSFFDNVPLDLQGDICDEQVVLTSNLLHGLNYQWYRNGIAISGENSDSLTISRSDTGQYILRVDDGTDCQLTNPFDYYPEVAITQIDTSVCQGNVLALEGRNYTAQSLDTFTYPSTNFCDSLVIVNVDLLDTSRTMIDSTICSGQSVQIGSQNFDSEGIHLVTLPNQAGCDSTIRLNLQIEDTLYLTQDTAICMGEVIVVRGRNLSTAGNYQFQYSDADNCNIELDLRVNVRDTFYQIIDTTICSGQPLFQGGSAVTSADDYQFDLQSQAGCDSTVIFRTSLFQVYNIQIDTSFCEGTQIVLEGQNIDTPGDYPFNFVSSDGCDSNIVYRVVEVSDYFTSMDTTICPDQDLIIWNDTIRQEGIFLVEKGLGDCDSTMEVNLTYFDSYQEDRDTSVCEGAGFIFEDSTYFESTEIAKMYNTIFGCDSLIMIRLDVVQEPDVTASVRESIRCFDATNGRVEVSVSDAQASVIWEDGVQGESRGNLGAGVYRFTVNYGSDCSVEDSIQLTQPEVISFTAEAQDISCMAETGGSITIGSIQGGTGSYRVFLNGTEVLDGPSGLSDLPAGDYDLVIQDENGCTESQQVEIEQALPGTVFLDASETDVTLGDEVLLSLTTIDIDSIVHLDWYGPQDNCPDDCMEWRVMPGVGDNIYTVILEDGNGCVYELSILIRATSEVYVPNAFSPNGDFINDFFFIYDNGSLEIIETLEIYDRWGEIVFQGQNLTPGDEENGWDGQFNGQPMMPGVYIYRLEAKNRVGESVILSGDVTLVR